MPASVRVRVPAKINLHLSVGGLRPDGYHELVTVFHAVDLCDEVIASEADRLSLRVSGGPAASVPADARNLAWRAAKLLAEAAGVPAAVHLEVDKAIPVAGGMAGGSADAAAALVACAALWGVEAELPALAARLGSDVPFALTGGTALGTGRGEVLEPVPAAASWHWVLVPAAGGISTPAAYRELDRLRAGGAAPEPAGAPHALLAALAAGDVKAVAAALANDLEPAALALRPALRATLEEGRAAGALAGIVSGSGPTCAFLCASAEQASEVAGALPGAVRATGPAPGAHVVG